MDCLAVDSILLYPCVVAFCKSLLYLQATKLRKYVLLPVTCSDRRVESVEADSATTALDMCTAIASKLKLKDIFGFSIYICIYDKVREEVKDVLAAFGQISEILQNAQAKIIQNAYKQQNTKQCQAPL
jgi:hypothetical protein